MKLFSDTVSLNNFVKVPDGQVFVLMQKTDCLSRKATSLTFSVSFLTKFCTSWNLRNYEPETCSENISSKINY